MRKRLLVVEDDVELLELLKLSFRAAGFSVTTASDGIEALKKARSATPDLILLDLVLPELDGFAVCETLRRNRASASTPIILLTGLSSELSRLAGFESGATDFISKPASPKELILTIKYYLRHPPQAPPAPASKAGPLRMVACVE
jgi:DNA-binding response OmpR family regulator